MNPIAILYIVLGLIFGSSAGYRMKAGDMHTIVIVQMVAAVILFISGITQLNN